jgi:thiol:disulfide interchange protein DsbA
MRTIIVLLALVSTIVFADPNFKEGQQYQRVPATILQHAVVQDLIKEGKDKVLVLEFFSYGCHWCFKLDPYVETLRKKFPPYVEFQRVPVEFQPSWRTLTKAYYTQLDLKAQDKVHTSLFTAIHTNRFNDASDENLKMFFVARGISPEDFTKTYTSFDVARKQKWAVTLSKTFQIMAVPTFVVIGPKGAFQTTMSMAGNETMLANVVNYLVQMEKS